MNVIFVNADGVALILKGWSEMAFAMRALAVLVLELNVAMVESQSSLPLFKVASDDKNVEWFIGFLGGRDWMTAREVLPEAGWTDSESNRRALRLFAEASGGRIAGDQRGYKLVTAMTHKEYMHWRNWMKSQADQMTARVVR